LGAVGVKILLLPSTHCLYDTQAAITAHFNTVINVLQAVIGTDSAKPKESVQQMK